LDFNDYVHSLGRATAHLIREYVGENYPSQEFQLEYGLSGWLLINQGQDYFSTLVQKFPDDWWIGYETNLGAALGSYYVDPENGLLRRDFVDGMVLLNKPGQSSVQVNLAGDYQSLQGEVQQLVNIDAASGRVFKKLQ
ncbi:MAG: hypothetical protein OEY38_22980, partial [Gammaproteobacteria bacterium]|nr:hypothetical protein [Gammaproteobacteria bacterium]